MYVLGVPFELLGCGSPRKVTVDSGVGATLGYSRRRASATQEYGIYAEDLQPGPSPGELISRGTTADSNTPTCSNGLNTPNRSDQGELGFPRL
jgi:hypothetical protein